jgi:small conductance mechanosensitive channel
MLTNVFQTIILPFAVRVLLALLVFYVGRWIAKNIQRWAKASLQKTSLTPSLVTLITALSYYFILILTGVLMLAVLGVPTATLAAIAGIVVVVLAITLQQSLGNLAATIQFLLFKPFGINDVIETGGVLGVVHEIQMFTTTLIAPDGKTHILPNGKIQGSGLTNYSTTNRLRLNLNFHVSNRDIDQAKAILMNLLAADQRVLPEPAARVYVQELNGNNIQLAVWPFVRVEDYLTFQTYFVEQAKKAFDHAGIAVPIPLQDVHLISDNGEVVGREEAWHPEGIRPAAPSKPPDSSTDGEGR